LFVIAVLYPKVTTPYNCIVKQLPAILCGRMRKDWQNHGN